MTMPKFIEQADIKKLIVWLFLSNITLIGIICSGAVYIHNSAIKDLKVELEEAKSERKQIIAKVHQLDVKVAGIKK